jgi:uroporphyrinogen decarboxylase
MKPREIVQSSFSFKNSTVVPYWIPFDAEVGLKIDEYYASAAWRERLIPYMFGQHYGGYEEAGTREGTIRDVFGSLIQTGNMQHVIQPALATPSLRGYHWPDPADIEDWDAVARKYSQVKESYRLCGLGYGLFERAWLMRGMENLLIDLISNPQFVEELLDGILDFHLRSMDIIVHKIPIEGYFGGDDWCDQRGCIMGPDLWRKLFKPRFAKIVDHCHQLGFPIILHSCGNVLPLIDDLLEIGLDGLESLQPEAMDVFLLKKRTMGKMVLIGGLGVQSTLPFATPEQVKIQTKKLLDELGAGGGYVLAPAKPLMADVPTENAVALIETVINN